MKNYDQSVEKNHNPNWTYILDDPYSILIIGCSGSRETNVLLNLIKNQRPDNHRQNLFMCQRFISIKVSITY